MTQFAIDATKALAPVRDAAAPEPKPADDRSGEAFADRLQDAASDVQSTSGAGTEEPTADVSDAGSSSDQPTDGQANAAEPTGGVEEAGDVEEAATSDESAALAAGDALAEVEIEAGLAEPVAVPVVVVEAPEAEEAAVTTEPAAEPAPAAVEAPTPEDNSLPGDSDASTGETDSGEAATSDAKQEGADDRPEAPVTSDTGPIGDAAEDRSDTANNSGEPRPRPASTAEARIADAPVADEAPAVSQPAAVSGEQSSGGERRPSSGADRKSSDAAVEQSVAIEDVDAVELVAASAADDTEPAPAAEAPRAAPESREANQAALNRIAAGRLERPTGGNAPESEPPRVDPSRFVSRVSGAFRAAQERGGEVQLRLSPPELGVLQVKLTLSEGVLAATLETETAAARNLLLDHLPALRERLAEQEIRVEKFDVDVRDEGGRDTRDWSPGDRRREQRDGAQREAGNDPGRSEQPTEATPLTPPIDDGRINLVA